MKPALIKNSSTWFLRAAIVVLGLGVLVILAIPIPLEIIEHGIGEFFPFWVIMYLTAIPFYIALWQGMKLLRYIDSGTAFSQQSVLALDRIKKCALAIVALYVIAYPFVFKAADMDDAPGIVLVWAGIIGGPMVIAVFAALLQTLLRNIIDIKSENDLTV